MRSAIRILIASSVLAAWGAFAETVIIDSDLADSYHFVDTYEILIDRPPEVVWPYLLDVASWMYELSMIHESGPHSGENEVYRLYEGQDYFMEITKLIPGKLMVAVNLPSTTQAEESVGVGMFTLTEIDGKTLVSNVMSRHFAWKQESPNPLRAQRESEEFQKSTQATWGKFLGRLRELAEGSSDALQ